MANDPLVRRNQYGFSSDVEIIDGTMLDNATLQSGEWITIWSETVKADQELHWGYGPAFRDQAQAFAFAELFANGSGTGDDDDDINGTLRFAITDSTGDTLVSKNYDSLANLKDAEADSRTERPVNPELAPSAREDRNLELKVKATSGSDGVVVANDSNVRLYYGRQTF
jgi:hypothetical protein